MAQYPSPLSDSQADATLASLVTGTVVPAGNVPIDDAPHSSQPKATRSNAGKEVLPPTAMRLLAAILKDPMRPSSEYAKLAGMSPNTLVSARGRLAEAGLVREHKLDSGRRGRAAILLEATEAAQELLAGPKEGRS